MSNQKKYKQDPIIGCFVPLCNNKVISNPEKYFFPIPTKTKAEWCTVAHKKNVPKGRLYICEDHLNLEEDLQNYENWKTNNVRGRLKPFVSSLRNVSPKPTSEPYQEGSELCKINDCVADCGLSVQKTCKIFVDKGVLCVAQVSSKHVQTKTLMVTRGVSAHLPSHIKQKKTMMTQDSSEETPSIIGSTTEFSEPETRDSVTIITPKVGREFMLGLIKNNPMSYIGVPKKYYWVIDFLRKEYKVPKLYLVITLYKIKNNDPFSRIKDLFEVSLSTIWRLYYKTLPILKTFFKQLTYWPARIDIKRNLPLSFRINKEYANVQTIIDCFEIEIEKPKDPVHQALTWSQYKNCNTIKYLIGATPDGFINFISDSFRYGGRISDMYIVEQSGFLETVPDNCTVLADRGFKHLESHLINKNVSVLRPPSVSKDTKMTKAEVLETKVIASLRIHIERVIRRVRLFKLLKMHAVVNNKIVSTLDDVVIVACGLINLQSPLIKSY